jgi:hypothetical protein
MSKISLAAAVLSLAAGAAQAAIPANITFDGYCDGLTNLSSSGGLVLGTHSYANCGAYTDEGVMGVTGKRLAGNDTKGYSLTEASYAQWGGTYGWTVNTDGTWVLYLVEYGAVINSGTWTAGYPLNGVKSGKVTMQK